MKDTTIVIPNRDGKVLDFVIRKMKSIYKNSQFLVITQEDDKVFMKGQLLNIAARLVSTKYIMFLDNDMFLNEYIDLEKIYNENSCVVYQPFTHIAQVYLDSNEEYQVLYTDRRSFYQYNELQNFNTGVSCGGCIFMSVENFKKYYDYSNLYLGWEVRR